MKRVLKIILRVFVLLFLLLNIVTAFHAYKFTHFYDNGSVQIKKPEEKTGWDKTREILFGINAVKQKNDITADSTFQTVYLITENRLKLEAWYIPVTGAIGTVCMFHGHGSKKSAIYKESEAFRKMGYNTLLLDFRAHGNSEGNTTTIGFFEAEDVKLAYDYIAAKGEKNIILWGISMGASAVSKAMNDYALQPKKIILEMPFASILQAGEGRIRMMGLPPEPLAYLVTFWGGVEHGFWAFNMKPVEFVKKIHCPVLLQWGRNDSRVGRSEVEAIFANIKNVDKKFVEYENCGHESLCKKENKKWMSEVGQFLK